MRRLFLFPLFFLAAGFLLAGGKKINALTFDYPKYDVDITINQDSTFTVRETATYKFFGEAHGLRRDVTLENPGLCSDTSFTCGGFDRLIVAGVYDGDGKKLSDSDFSTYEIEDLGKKYFRFEWEIWPNGKNLDGDEVTWSVEYKILGGIRWVGANPASEVPYFYWNVLPEDRGGDVAVSQVNIKFPDSVNLKSGNFEVYTIYDNDINLNRTENSIAVDFSDLDSYGPVTVSYRFSRGELQKPATLEYKVISPTSGLDVFLDGDKISDSSQEIIEWFPTGEHSMKFERFGYKTKTVDLNLKSGEEKYLEIELKIEPWMQVLKILNYVIMCCGIFTIPAAILFVYLRYQSRGKDVGMPKTIIPLFKPPEGVQPYILGTLKDEKVDKEDIVGSIIDLAYRGYIKIKELEKGKKYELTKLEGKEGDKGLNDIENQILDAIFGSSDKTTTATMRTRFPQKYPGIVNKVYKETVSRGYFSTSPRAVRGTYFGLGLALTTISIACFICFTISISGFLGTFSVFTPAIGLITAGLGILIVANFMPAKSQLGSKTFADILGFKMYLQTAERFRLQNLGPEEFERYLSYAIVFKIEKEWAKKFEGIYEGTPDWYEGSTKGVTDAMLISGLTRSFANTAITSITPVSSGSSSGGGWSGSSGSFGGFSGGGGGGGSSGAW